MTLAAKKNALTYEERLAALQQIVAQLEGGSIPLEEAMKLYRQGQELAQSLQRDLEAAEKAIEARPEAAEE